MPDEKAENITDVEQQNAAEENPLTSVAFSRFCNRYGGVGRVEGS